MNKAKKVINLLHEIQDDVGKVVSFDLNKENILILDLSTSNPTDISDTEKYSKYISANLEENKSAAGIGKYNENRTIYRRPLFEGGKEPRTVHLGIDISAKPGTPIYAPLPAKVHSFNNNSAYGDYGPTIILKHTIKGITFYTLYGHLSLDSLKNLSVGKTINKGERIAKIGNSTVNGNWPPHLHFQIITNMQGKKGDFPGVASLSEREKYLELCPDSNLILKIKKLK